MIRIIILSCLLGCSIVRAQSRPVKTLDAKSIAALQRAVTVAPKDEAARRRLALACEGLEDWLCVVEQFQFLAELKPQEAEYAYQLGRAYTRLSEWCYQRIIALDPDAARLHQALGQQYLTQGKYDLALAEYRRAAVVDPKLPEIHLAIAVIHLEQRNLDEAGKEIALELQLAPESRKALEIKQKIAVARKQ
jgi:tetratricopeptide (TPR) repeat protein